MGTCPHCGGLILDGGSDEPTDFQFQAFYDEYPRKEARAGAYKAYKVARKKIGHQDIMKALGRSKQFWEADGRLKVKPYTKVPLPATWLNQERWLDEYGGAQQQLSMEEEANRLRSRFHG